MVTSRAVAAAGGWYARSDGWTRAVTAMAIALAHTRATVTTPDAARAGASATPTRSITSQAQTRAVRCPTTMLWNRDVGCPGLLATASAVGPSAAKSQGCDVATLALCRARTDGSRRREQSGTSNVAIPQHRRRTPYGPRLCLARDASRRRSGRTGPGGVGRRDGCAGMGECDGHRGDRPRPAVAPRVPSSGSSDGSARHHGHLPPDLEILAEHDGGRPRRRAGR